MAGSSPPVPVSLAFICSAGEVSDGLVAAWGRTGQKLGAVVVSEAPRRKPLSATLLRLRKSGVPVLPVDHPVDWEDLGARLRGVSADALLCYGFMRFVPGSFLDGFRCGGLNFHPALLPAYAGPHPTRCLVADGTYGVHGGLTLHRMSDAFDEGAVLARARFRPGDFGSARLYRAVLVETMVAMIRDVLPLHCAGLLVEEAQQGDVRTWARYAPRSVIVDAGWRAEDIVAAAAFLGGRKGVCLRLGERMVRIGELRSVLGPPDGRGPCVGPFSVEFDCADARVRMRRAGRAARLEERVRSALARFAVRPEARTVECIRLNEAD